MTSRFKSTAVLFVAALLLAAFASTAAFAADRVEVGSRVTIAQDYAFHGQVFSKRDICERNRTIAVYLVTPGADGLYDTTPATWAEHSGHDAVRDLLLAREA